jgi:hypothetical protein
MSTPQDISKQQLDILNRVAEGGLPCICVSAVREGDPKTQADSASFSRSVSRLDRRGLLRSIVFHYAGPGERANGLLMTPEGLAIHERPARTRSAESEQHEARTPTFVAQPQPDAVWHRCETCNTPYQGPMPRFGTAKLCPRCVPKRSA